MPMTSPNPAANTPTANTPTTSAPTARAISHYTLYSEAPSEQDPEFVHIEDIPVRARVFDWEINVHTHPNLYQLVYVKQGRVRIMIDGQESNQQGPVLISLPAGVVHGFEFERDNTVGWVITVSQLLIRDDSFVRQFPFRQALLENPRITALQPGQDLVFLEQSIEQLEAEYSQENTGKKAMFAWLFFALMTRLGRMMKQLEQTTPVDLHSDRFQKLNQLIEQHYRDHRPVEFYAEQLTTTPASLSRTCKQVAGKTITDLLYDRLILEAQRMLIYSSIPVSLVGYDLGFSDPAYFSRFFRRRVGLSPSEFREQRENR